MVAGPIPVPPRMPLRCRPMRVGTQTANGARLRTWCAGACVAALALGACGGGSSGSSAAPLSSGRRVVDVKAACAALADLHRSGDGLNGVNVADPTASEAALVRATAAYRAALVRFERLGPASLRASADAVVAAVAAREFARAAAARAAIDAWASAHCS
jgi:hypothetical protein